ncbi:MAG: hypothetical protein IKI67_06495 [Bacteroidales bacterium]|nr:hypothetical protein [Bacteroidales bacterium]
MRNNNLYYIGIISSFLLLAMGCTKNDTTTYQKAGNGIVFTANTAYKTKSNATLALKDSLYERLLNDENTVYETIDRIYYDFISGEEGNPSMMDSNTISSNTRFSGEMFTIGSSTIERIDWVPGDQITIRQSAGDVRDVGEYSITEEINNSNNKSSGKITHSSASYLQWVKGCQNKFVAVYPSLSKRKVQPNKWIDGENDNSTVIDGIYSLYPNTQYSYYNSETGSYETDMTYAYMLAGTTVEASNVPNNNTVLSFYPNFNAVEVHLLKPANYTQVIKLKKATLKANVEIAMYNYASIYPSLKTTIVYDGVNRPSTIVGKASNNNPALSQKAATIRFRENRTTNTDTYPELSSTTPLKFTFFTYPVDIPQLSIEFELDINGEVVTRELKLQRTVGGTTEWIPLEKYKKLRITNLNANLDNIWNYGLTTINNLTVENTGAETSKDFTFSSYKKLKRYGSTLTYPVPVKAQFSLDNTNFYALEDPAIPTEITDIVKDIKFQNTDNDFTGTIYFKSNNEFRQSRKNDLSTRNDISSVSGYTSLSGFADLSQYDFVNDRFRASGQPQTANSYVIRRPGKYSFPLVYGNGLDYNRTPSIPFYNTQAYNPIISAPTKEFLSNFQRHDGTAITDPWIHKNIFSGNIDDFNSEYEAVIVWQDVASEEQFVEDLQVTLLSPVGLSADSGERFPYITFSIPSSKIQEGNALIALRTTDASKTIVWSWHIWISAENLSTAELTNYTGDKTNLLPIPLGYNKEGYSKRYLFVKVIQDESGGVERDFRVIQPKKQTDNATYYQWGRKDPLLPSNGTREGKNKVFSSPAEYLIDGVNSSAVSGASNVLNISTAICYDFSLSIQNPHIMYYNSSREGAWYYRNGISKAPHTNLWSAFNETRYGSGDETVLNVYKTVYDPCPPGFCVPNRFVFTGITKTGDSSGDANDFNIIKPEVGTTFDSGYVVMKNSTDTEGLFLPALGIRYYQSSISNYQLQETENGYYWSAEQLRFNYACFYLRFNSGYIYPSFSTYSNWHAMNIFPAQEKQ